MRQVIAFKSIFLCPGKHTGSLIVAATVFSIDFLPDVEEFSAQV